MFLFVCLIVMVGVGAFRGLLDTRTSFYVVVVMEIFYFGLDLFFIYGIGLFLVFDVVGVVMVMMVVEWVGVIWFWKFMMDEEILDF